MSPAQVALGALVGLAAGILSGLFGVGGGIITTPAVNVLLGGSAIEAVATPLPVIFPTTIVGAATYARAGEVSFRAARWASGPGALGAILGALLTERVNAHLLLVVTAGLIGWTAIRLVRGGPPRAVYVRGATPWHRHVLIGFVAGFVSGLLGVGGGIVLVPAYTVLVGMPLRRALGTSLVVISAIVVPGTLVHWWLGHIDWAIFAALTVGVVPGAHLGARIALGVRERTLRLVVGLFFLGVAVAYGSSELVQLLGARG